MRAVRLTGAVADPDHVTGARDVLAGDRIHPRQRLFVFQQQRLVAGVKVHAGKFIRRVAVHPGCVHEVQGVGNPVRHLAVAFGLVMLGKAQRPGMHPVDIGETAGRERAQKVQGRRRLRVGLQHPLRVGDAGFGRGVEAVDDVALVGRHLDPVDHLGRGGPRLGELAGHAANLDHRHLGGIGQHHRHLQHHPERVADVVGRELREAFGAVAALQEERLAFRRQGQLLFQPPRLTGEDQWRIFGQLRLDQIQRCLIGIIRHLNPRFCAPCRLGPSLGHRLSPVGRSSCWTIGLRYTPQFPPLQRAIGRKPALSALAAAPNIGFLGPQTT